MNLTPVETPAVDAAAEKPTNEALAPMPDEDSTPSEHRSVSQMVRAAIGGRAEVLGVTQETASPQILEILRSDSWMQIVIKDLRSSSFAAVKIIIRAHVQAIHVGSDVIISRPVSEMRKRLAGPGYEEIIARYLTTFNKEGHTIEIRDGKGNEITRF